LRLEVPAHGIEQQGEPAESHSLLRFRRRQTLGRSSQLGGVRLAEYAIHTEGSALGVRKRMVIGTAQEERDEYSESSVGRLRGKVWPLKNGIPKPDSSPRDSPRNGACTTGTSQSTSQLVERPIW